MSSQNDIVQTLTESESRELLEANSFGRLAFAIAGSPEIMPINYCFTGGKLYFRTAEGSKLLGVTINHEIAFEIDGIDGDVATSVIFHGHARELQTDAEIEFVESLPLWSWIDTPKFHYLEVTPEQITGRQFRLRKPHE